MDEQPIIHLGAPKENKPKIKPMIIPEDSFDEEFQDTSKNESEKEEYKRRKFNIYYSTLTDLYLKKQYKKLLNTIKEEFNDNWYIKYIRLEAIHKIICRKFINYASETKIKGIIHWLKELDNELNSFIILTYNNSEDEKYIKEKIEIIITFSLKQCYNYARFCLHEFDVIQAIKFLAIGEKLIKSTSDFFLSPNTLFYSALIYIVLGSLFIGNKDYDTAKNYLATCLKLLYKDLEIRLNEETDKNTIVSYVYNISNYPMYKKDKLSKDFFYMSIACFQLGVCYENQYDIYKALQLYQQAKFFGKTLPYKKGVEFINTLFELVGRQKLRCDIIKFFEEENKDVVVKEEIKIKTVKLPFREEEKRKKFERIEKFINTLQLDEVDDDEPDLLNKVNSKPYGKKVGIVTKQIHVLNYLMSDEFHNVINGMNKIEINKLNPETKMKIQKNIRNIKNNERMKLEILKKEKEENAHLFQSENKSKSSFNNIYNNFFTPKDNILNSNIRKNNRNNTVNLDFNENISLPSIPNSVRHLNSKSKTNSIIKKSKIDLMKNENYEKEKKPLHNLYKKNKTEIPRYKNDSKLFNKKYCRKKAFLEEQYDKELKFQKAMLRCKTEEKEKIQDVFNERKVKLDAEEFYHSTLLKKIMEENEKKRNKEIENELNLRRERPKIANYYSKSKISNYEISLTDHCIKQPNELNQEMINDITREIEYIKRREFLLQKIKNQKSN